MIGVPASVTACLFLGSDTIENTTLTRLALVHRQPLFHECLYIGLLCVAHAVVRQATLWVVLPPRTTLSIAHPVVRQIAQANQGRATNTTNNDSLANLTHDVMAFDAGQLASRCCFERLDAELEKANKWLRARSSTTENLKSRTSRTHLADIPTGYLSCVQEANQFLKCLGPSQLRIFNHDSRVRFSHIVCNARKFRDVLSFNSKADSSSAHEDIHSLIKRSRMVTGNVATIK